MNRRDELQALLTAATRAFYLDISNHVNLQRLNNWAPYEWELSIGLDPVTLLNVTWIDKNSKKIFTTVIRNVNNAIKAEICNVKAMGMFERVAKWIIEDDSIDPSCDLIWTVCEEPSSHDMAEARKSLAEELRGLPEFPEYV